MDFGSAGATLHMFRRPAYSNGAVVFSVRIDGVEAFKIRPNESVKVPIRPGEHRVQVTMWSRQGSRTLAFHAAPGEEIRLVCQGTMRPLHPIDLDRDDLVGAEPPSTSPSTSPNMSPNTPTVSPDVRRQPPIWAGPGPAAPERPWPEQALDLVEVRESDQFEEPLGEEVRVIDNRKSATGVTRNVRASREWTRTMSISADRTRTIGGELGGGPAWLKVKGSVEQQLHRTYSTDAQSKQVFAEEITITVPARTSVRLVLSWKRIWQRGVVRVTDPSGVVHEVPYQVVVNVTFDQSQQDVEPDGPGHSDHPVGPDGDATTRLYWTPPTA